MILGRLLFIPILTVGLFACNSGPQPEFKVPSEAAVQKNPIPATPDSISQGSQRYRSGDCSRCHGKNGDGKGLLAKDISMNLHNWRDPSVQSQFTDGELFYIMDKGKGSSRGRMPAYHDQETQNQIWQMVNYVRSFAGIGNSK